MITFEEAYEMVMDRAVRLGTESVPLAESLHRILAQDVCSDIDMPPFDKSAMDGYACRRVDLQNILTVIENIPAGVSPQKSVGENECSKIMTGAVVPDGADCVIMVEYTDRVSENRIRFLKDDTKGNICFRGEDVKAGDMVLKKGARILPQHIAVLATAGCSEPLVSVKPRVGVIATGSELVEPSEKADGPKIRNSNGWQLAAQVEQAGAVANNYGIAVDIEEVLDAVVKKALAENDVLLLSGGVSMGDYDLVPGILRDNGIQLLFDKVAIQPGRPSTFGVSETMRCFGLPGNPVSTFTQFELLVKPFLFQMMGGDAQPDVVPAALKSELKRRRSDRAATIPVKFVQPGVVEKVDYHGSAHITAMCETDGFIRFPLGEIVLKKGARVDVVRLS